MMFVSRLSEVKDAGSSPQALRFERRGRGVSVMTRDGPRTFKLDGRPVLEVAGGFLTNVLQRVAQYPEDDGTKIKSQ